MPRRPRDESEVFTFAVEDWSVDYSLHLNSDDQTYFNELLGRCWETHGLALRGPLTSKTRRKIERVVLELVPTDFKPKEVDERVRAIGSVKSVRLGTMTCSVWIPLLSFNTLLAAATARKIPGAQLTVEEMGRNDGRIRSFIVTDPDEDQDE
jgi:hypothetical protein